MFVSFRAESRNQREAIQCSMHAFATIGLNQQVAGSNCLAAHLAALPALRVDPSASLGVTKRQQQS